jgi:uncharacterized protein
VAQAEDDTIPQAATGHYRTITDTYETHAYVTPSGMLTLPHFEFAHKVLGCDRILYTRGRTRVSGTPWRLPVGQGKIAHQNAETLLRLV